MRELRDYQIEYDVQRMVTQKVKEELWIKPEVAEEIWNQTGRFLLTEFQLNTFLAQVVASTPSDFYINGLGRPAGLDGF